jgi:hypothetical protein
MLKVDVRARMGEILQLLDSEPDFWATLSELREGFDAVAEALAQLITRADTDSLHQARNLCVGLTSSLEKLPPGATFRTLHRLEDELGKLDSQWHPDHEVRPLATLELHVGLFLNAYETYISRRVIGDAFRVFFAAATLADLRDAVTELAGSIHVSLVDLAVPDAGGELTIRFDAPQTIRSVRDKLEALEVLYREIADLVSVDTAEDPLEIRALETGSFWIELIGNETVLGLLASGIGTSAIYYYNQFRLARRLPRGAQQMEALLALKQQMQELGLSTANADAELEAAFTRMAQQMRKLVGDEPSIAVNGERFGLPDLLHVPYLESGRRLLPPGEDDEDLPTT